jgi:hypothetical protein
LATKIVLAAQASAQAACTASLTVGNYVFVPTARTFTVGAETRSLVIAAQPRSYAVGAEARGLVIAADPRIESVALESRRLSVLAE